MPFVTGLNVQHIGVTSLEKETARMHQLTAGNPGRYHFRTKPTSVCKQMKGGVKALAVSFPNDLCRAARARASEEPPQNHGAKSSFCTFAHGTHAVNPVSDRLAAKAFAL